jgi:hypothetical protein
MFVVKSPFKDICITYSESVVSDAVKLRSTNEKIMLSYDIARTSHRELKVDKQSEP